MVGVDVKRIDLAPVRQSGFPRPAAAPEADDPGAVVVGHQDLVSPVPIGNRAAPIRCLAPVRHVHEDVVGDAKLAHFTPKADLDRKIRRRNPGPGLGGWFMEDEYVFDRHSAWIKDLVEAGGRTGIGSHGQLQGLGYHWELWALQSGGMSNHDALRVATLMGAEAIGLGGDLGSIEGGKLADLVVLEANPLDDIRNTNTVRYVMKNGRLYDGNTLDEIWPRQRPAADEPWRHIAPVATTTIRGAGR